ncbi:hypothetical protein [Halorubrum vacuolatum]|uniref:Uncharacterized protein n=1 Tax=Halorubrum vacuolatum TaxID=63740 RepID=A0A238X8Q4_HALVU|nr:hypothetical protein [Halorubrum vacuolatum]SNR54941.1 hypothetical protein SAMN06264855_11462 [Halorubrum vacuolatum]
MSEQPSREPPSDESAARERVVRGDDAGVNDAAAGNAVDDDVKRRLEQAYLNDEEDVLVVCAVRSAADGDEVHVDLRPPHGDVTHTERFTAPKHGSLAECTDLLAFLNAAGVSPLDLDALVGTRVPASFDPETGWRVDPAYVSPEGSTRPGGETEAGTAEHTRSARWERTVEWLRTYRDWLIVILVVGFELLLIVVLILLFA